MDLYIYLFKDLKYIVYTYGQLFIAYGEIPSDFNWLQTTSSLTFIFLCVKSLKFEALFIFCHGNRQ